MVNFTTDGLHVVSGSDDTVLRYWDVSTETSISELHGHEVLIIMIEYFTLAAPGPLIITLIALIINFRITYVLSLSSPRLLIWYSPGPTITRCVGGTYVLATPSFD